MGCVLYMRRYGNCVGRFFQARKAASSGSCRGSAGSARTSWSGTGATRRRRPSRCVTWAWLRGVSRGCVTCHCLVRLVVAGPCVERRNTRSTKCVAQSHADKRSSARKRGEPQGRMSAECFCDSRVCGWRWQRLFGSRPGGALS